MAHSMDDLVFIGLAGKVIALHRDSGEQVWIWDDRKRSGAFVQLLLDGDRLVVALNGYITCLDAQTGSELWYNPLKGQGVGVCSAVSVRGASLLGPALAAMAQQQSS